MNQVTFITPTYAPDFERFAFQRESLERCGIDIPHIAIVHTEDLERFKTIPHKKGLEILSTRDVLGEAMDRRRRAWGVRRLNILHWIVRHPVHGWVSQQLVKLAAANIVQTDGIVCLDSDTFFIDRVTHNDFFNPADGRLALYETGEGLDAEMASWPAKSMYFLGLKPTGHPVKKYAHSPACLHRGVVKDLLDYIEKQHNKPWTDAFIRAEVFEYSTYGVFATLIDKFKRVFPTRPAIAINYWWNKDVDQFESGFLDRVSKGREKAVLLQSNSARSPVEFRELIEQAWRLRLA